MFKQTTFIALAITLAAIAPPLYQTTAAADALPFLQGNHSLVHRASLLAAELREKTPFRQFNANERSEIERVRQEVNQLRHLLNGEAAKLRDLHDQRSAIKNAKGWGWFFDKDARAQVDRTQMAINDQQRVIVNIAEDIQLHFRQVKPIYGVWSEMFLADVFSFVPWTIEIVLETFAMLMWFDLLSLLIMGPVAIFLGFFWLSLGFAVLPALFAIVSFFVGIYWIFELPFIVIQYEPTPIEFAGIYFTFVLMFALLSRAAWHYFARRSRF